MRRFAAAALALGLWLAGARGQEPETAPPDLDFFEYLGAWAEDDDEWLALEELEKRAEAEPDDELGAAESDQESEDEDESE